MTMAALALAPAPEAQFSCFKLIADGFDVQPALEELLTKGITRQCPVPIAVNFPGYNSLIELFRQGEAVLAHLGPVEGHVRAIGPYGQVPFHTDWIGEAADPLRQRYILCLQCDDGFVFSIEAPSGEMEECRFKPGELWQIDIGDRRHGAVNNSPHRRIALFFDVVLSKRPSSPKARWRGE
jgi:hypothetical protein